MQQTTRFTVIDAQNPKADVTVATGLVSLGASSGHQVLFSVQVNNLGPDGAPVTLTNDVPANTTFESFGQLGGPTFTCTNPNTGETGTSTCTITNLGRGESATFLATYLVGTVSNGTVLSNTASATTTTAESDPDNNTSTSEVTVTNAPCVLSNPENITVDADAGQAGAVVTYVTPTGTGDCGSPTTGENG